jgi:hypothetical protein
MGERFANTAAARVRDADDTCAAGVAVEANLDR